MVTASELKPGMAIRIEARIYRVAEVEARAGTAKMGGTVRVRLENARSGRVWDQHFRPLEKLEDVELENHTLEFLYRDGSNCLFQRLDTFEQIEFPAERLGLAERFLQPGDEVPADFFGEEPISVDVPETVEARVKTTAPPARSQPDSGRKDATLENGMTVQVPLFVAPGEIVSVDVKTGRYLERVRLLHKKGA